MQNAGIIPYSRVCNDEKRRFEESPQPPPRRGQSAQMYADACAYAEFGEIQSGYDARAMDNSMTSQGLEICARATPELDFAKYRIGSWLRATALRPNRPWRSPRDPRGRRSHADSVEKTAYAQHLRTKLGAESLLFCPPVRLGCRNRGGRRSGDR